MHIIYPTEHVPEAVTIDSQEGGPDVVIFGGVHGCEIGGIHAVDKLLFDFVSGYRTLEYGRVTVVRANRCAINAGKRMIRYNMNRLFLDQYPENVDVTSSEFKRAQQLKQIVAETNYLLDLHATSVPTEPHLLLHRDTLHKFCGLGVGKIITGWNDVMSPGRLDGTTEAYARSYGAYAATLECGGKEELSSLRVAYASAIRLLHNLDLIHALSGDKPVVPEPPMVFHCDRVIRKRTADFRWLLQDFYGFMPLATDAPIAVDGDTVHRAGEQEWLLMPTANPKLSAIGEEVFFIGKRV